MYTTSNLQLTFPLDPMQTMSRLQLIRPVPLPAKCALYPIPASLALIRPVKPGRSCEDWALRWRGGRTRANANASVAATAACAVSPKRIESESFAGKHAMSTDSNNQREVRLSPPVKGDGGTSQGGLANSSLNVFSSPSLSPPSTHPQAYMQRATPRATGQRRALAHALS